MSWLIGCFNIFIAYFSHYLSLTVFWLVTTNSPPLLTNPRSPRRFLLDFRPSLGSGEQEHASQRSWNVLWQLSAAVFTDFLTRNQRVQLWGEHNRLISIRQIGLPKDFKYNCRLWFLWFRLKDVLCPPCIQSRSEGNEYSKSSAVRFCVNHESKNVFSRVRSAMLGSYCEVLSTAFVIIWYWH